MQSGPEQSSRKLSPLAAGLWGFAIVLGVYILADVLLR